MPDTYFTDDPRFNAYFLNMLKANGNPRRGTALYDQVYGAAASGYRKDAGVQPGRPSAKSATESAFLQELAGEAAGGTSGAVGGMKGVTAAGKAAQPVTNGNAARNFFAVEHGFEPLPPFAEGLRGTNDGNTTGPTPAPAPGPAPSPSPTPAPDAGTDAFLKQLDFRDEQADRLIQTPTSSPQPAQVIPKDLQNGTIFDRTDKPVGPGYAPRYNPEPGELVMPRVESIYSGLPVEQKQEILAEQDKAQQLQLARRAQNIVISNALKAATQYTQGVQKLAMGAAEAATQAATNQKVVEQYCDVLTNYLKEKGRDYYYGLDGHYEKLSAIGKPGISYELFNWLDKGYDIGDLMLPEAAEGGKGFVETAAEYLSIGTHPVLSLLRIPVPWDHQPTPEEYAANIEKWASAIGLSPQEKQKLLDPVYRNVHGLKEGEIREFIPGYDDIDVLKDTPKMKDYRGKMQGIIKRAQWGPTERDKQEYAILFDAYQKEIEVQREEYEAKHGHAMPDAQDTVSWTAIDPGLNNPLIAAGRSFVAGPTLGLSDVLLKGVMPEESFAALERATSTHPLARDVGEVGGIAIPIDIGALAAGPAFKLIGKGINKIGGKIAGKITDEILEGAGRWGVKEAGATERAVAAASDWKPVSRATTAPLTKAEAEAAAAATRPSVIKPKYPLTKIELEARFGAKPEAPLRTAEIAGPRYPLTKAELDARIGAKPESPLRATTGERLPNGEIVPVKRTRPLAQSELDVLHKERPAQAAPGSAREPIRAPETAGGRNMEGRNLESTSKAEQPAGVVTGKVGEKAPIGKEIVPAKDGFTEGLLGEEGKGSGQAYDEFTEGLLGKEGKAGGSIEYTLESTGNTYIKNKKPVEVKQFTKELLTKKPKHSPTPEVWQKNGGKIYIDEDGVWTYLDWENHSVSYPNGYPDFNSAGLVIQKVELMEFKGYKLDLPEADRIAKSRGTPRGLKNTWHHYEDLKTLQEIIRILHERFRHIGGMSRSGIR